MSSLASDSEKLRKGAILYVDDSQDDHMIFETALNEARIENKVIHLHKGSEALAFLKEADEVPFIIISDVNMPEMDGFSLKAEIERDKELSLKAIPFIYLSTSTSRKDVKTAFYHQAQGYFEKPSNIEELTGILKLVHQYWSKSELPSNY